MGNRRLRRVFCSILKVDFFTLTFRQLERLVRGESLTYPGCLWVLETGEKSLVKRVPRFTLAEA